MNVTGVGSIVLNVADLERSKRLYGEILGLAFVTQTPDDHVVVYSAGPTAIVLHSIDAGATPSVSDPEDPGTVALMLSVRDKG